MAMTPVLKTCIGLLFWFSIFEFVYSYLLYPVLLRRLSRWFGKPSTPDENYFPSVAVVIPAFNEERVIAQKLQNVFSSDYPPEKVSVWIGSDCSTDHTEEIAAQFGDSRVHVWRPAERCGKAGILNQLIPQVEAEILLLTDADIMLDKQSIKRLSRHFADPKVGGVGGITLQSRGGALDGELKKSPELMYRNYEAAQKMQESLLHSTISAFGSFYAIRKTLFTPFHEHTYSNDDVMMPMNIVRQGYRMYFEPAAISYEEAVPEIKVEFNRRVRIGAGNFQAFFWLLDFLNPARGWPWFCYVSHKVSRWFSPLFLCLGALACAILALGNAGMIYKLLFAGGIFGVAVAALHRFIPSRLPRNAWYFIIMNFALICGLFRFLRGIRTATWARTQRPTQA